MKSPIVGLAVNVRECQVIAADESGCLNWFGVLVNFNYYLRSMCVIVSFKY